MNKTAPLFCGNTKGISLATKYHSEGTSQAPILPPSYPTVYFTNQRENKSSYLWWLGNYCLSLQLNHTIMKEKKDNNPFEGCI